MGYDNADVYYNPEKFGLTIVGEIDWHERSYDFDMTVVWVDSAGKFYWSSDSGCSCYAPFESVTSLDDSDLNSGTKWDVIAGIQNRKADYSWYTAYESERAEDQVAKLIEKLVLA